MFNLKKITLIIEIPEKEKDTVLSFLKKHAVKVQGPEKEVTREQVLAGLEQGLREAKNFALQVRVKVKAKGTG